MLDDPSDGGALDGAGGVPGVAVVADLDHVIRELVSEAALI
jgi:hypothetical protein